VTTRKRNRHYRRQLRRSYENDVATNPLRSPDYPMIARPCNRCGKIFEPRFNERIKYWAKCCEKCGLQNIMDMLTELDEE